MSTEWRLSGQRNLRCVIMLQSRLYLYAVNAEGILVKIPLAQQHPAPGLPSPSASGSAQTPLAWFGERKFGRSSYSICRSHELKSANKYILNVAAR